MISAQIHTHLMSLLCFVSVLIRLDLAAAIMAETPGLLHAGCMAFFERIASDRFRATENTRGPWNNAHQHGGPPAALCADAVIDDGPFRLAQLSVDFLRPVPIAELRREVEWLARGRTRERARITLFAGAKPVMEAQATRLLTVPFDRPTAAPLSESLPAQSAPWSFGFFGSTVGYHTAMELRIARGAWGKEPVAAWMRMRMPLIDGEPVAPAIRAIVAADAAHGISPCLDVFEYTLINPTLTVILDGHPVGDWILLDSESQAQHTGVGQMFGRLWDQQGLVGRAMAPLIVRKR